MLNYEQEDDDLPDLEVIDDDRPDDNTSGYEAREDDRDEEDTDDEENSDGTRGSNTNGSDSLEEPNSVRDEFDSESCNEDVDDGSALGEHDHAIPGAMSFAVVVAILLWSLLWTTTFATNGNSDDDDSHVALSSNFDTNEKREALSGHGDNANDKPYDGDDDKDDDESEHDETTRNTVDRYAHIRGNGLFSDKMDLEEVNRAEEGYATVFSVPLKAGEGDATSDTDDNGVVGNRRLFRHQQHLAYPYRGDQLKELNLYEYSALIVIQPERRNKTKERPVVDENAPIKERLPCATFPFSKNAPPNLRENFVQKLRMMPLTSTVGAKY
jgi:hypothetical protein